MDIESDEDALYDVVSEGEGDEEGEGEDAAHTEALHTRGDLMEEEEKGLRVEDIDSFWLQRQINEYMKDAEESQKLAEKIMTVLQSGDEVSVVVVVVVITISNDNIQWKAKNVSIIIIIIIIVTN